MERLVISEEERQQQLSGSTRIATGIWRDRDGCVHISVPELLELFDIADTPENRERCVQTVQQALLDEHPDAILIRQDLNQKK